MLVNAIPAFPSIVLSWILNVDEFTIAGYVVPVSSIVPFPIIVNIPKFVTVAFVLSPVSVLPLVSKVIFCPLTTVTLSVILLFNNVTVASLLPAKSIASCTLSKFVVTPFIVVLATTSLHTAYNLTDWSCV